MHHGQIVHYKTINDAVKNLFLWGSLMHHAEIVY